MPYGLLPTGFAAKTEDVLRAEMDVRLREALGNSVNLTNGVLARIRDAYITEVALLWELAQAVYAAGDPDAATGAALATICAISGTRPRLATRSTVTLHLTGDRLLAPTIPIGSRVSTDSTAQDFETVENASIPNVLNAWVASTAYAIGDVRSNVSRMYTCILAGTSAASGGPSTTADNILDGTARWRYLGDGTSYTTVVAQSVNTGPVAAFSGDLRVISTPVAGWQGALNLLDADLGEHAESDAALRRRREDEIDALGAATAESIKQALLEVPGVLFAQVFINDTDVTDADGLSPHSVEVVVDGGADQDVLNAVYSVVGAGIGIRSTSLTPVTGTVVDSEGVSHAVAFTRITNVPIYVALTLTYRASTPPRSDDYPANGDSAVREAIVQWADNYYTASRNVVSSAVAAQAFAVPGVDGVTTCNIGLAAAPGSSSPIAIGPKQRAVFDTSRITISKTLAAP